nr:hypothetical protein GCM10017611_79340 [Rhodococcus wratislaviensis]
MCRKSSLAGRVIPIERVIAPLQEPASRRQGAVATQSADSMNVTFGVRYFGECLLGWTAATGDFGSVRGGVRAARRLPEAGPWPFQKRSIQRKSTPVVHLKIDPVARFGVKDWVPVLIG